MAYHGFTPAPGCSALSCPEGAVFPPEAGVCPRPDFAPDSGDRSVLHLDLPPDLLAGDQGLDLAHLKSLNVILLFYKDQMSNLFRLQTLKCSSSHCLLTL